MRTSSGLHALDLMLVYQTLCLWLLFGTALYTMSFIFNMVAVYTFRATFYKLVLKVRLCLQRGPLKGLVLNILCGNVTMGMMSWV